MPGRGEETSQKLLTLIEPPGTPGWSSGSVKHAHGNKCYGRMSDSAAQTTWLVTLEERGVTIATSPDFHPETQKNKSYGAIPTRKYTEFECMSFAKCFQNALHSVPQKQSNMCEHGSKLGCQLQITIVCVHGTTSIRHKFQWQFIIGVLILHNSEWGWTMPNQIDQVVHLVSKTSQTRRTRLKSRGSLVCWGWFNGQAPPW